jgi:hypothetical protein
MSILMVVINKHLQHIHNAIAMQRSSNKKLVEYIENLVDESTLNGNGT